jgi:YVTN family beta-propeller protein
LVSNVAGSVLAPGSTVAGYRIEALIGRGGMGAVYRAEEEGLGRKVALKVIAPELAQDERFRERFLRESRIAASLDHPHVIPIYQAGEQDGVLYLAMRYVEGTDLGKLLAEEGALEPRRAVEILSQVAEALDAAHEKGLVHRDVKPSNVLIAEAAGREHCYLADFGLTKRTGSLSGVSVQGDVVGTLEYVAPEQITGDPLDERADVYSLGCVLYECLTGQSPFPRATDVALLWAHVHEEPTPPSKARPDLPRELDTVLARALAKEPGRRYRSTGELLAATRSALGIGETTGTRKQPRRRVVQVVLAAAGALIVTAVVASLLLHGGSEDGLSSVSANALGLVDADGDAIDADVPVDSSPTNVALGDDAIWVTNTATGTVSRIDRETRSVRQTIPVGSSPSGIAVGAGAVWVADHLDGTVTRIDPETNDVVDTITVGNGAAAVAFGDGSIWVTNSSDRTVSRIDPVSGRVVRTLKTDAVGRGIAVGGGSVWVTDESSRTVMRIDPEANRVVETISVGNAPTGIAFGEGAVWVANSIDETISRIDPDTAAVTATLAVAGGPAAIAAGGGAVWVSAEFDELLVRIDPDPADPRVVGEVAIGNRPKGVAIAGEDVWVAVQASGMGHRGGRLTITSAPLDSIDPTFAISTASLPAQSLGYDALTSYRRVGGSEGTQLVPDLASAIPDARDGGRSYTFRLRPGIRYSDGRRLQPEDFRRALERAYELNGYIAQQSLLRAVVGTGACHKGRPCDLSKGIETGSESVTFRLSEPDPLFASSVGSLTPIPPRTPPRDTGTKPVPGTGPYAIESYVPGRQLKFVRNPHFRVWSEAARPDGYADEIVFRIGRESWKDVMDVARGRIDLSGVPPERVGEVRARYSRQLHVEPDRATVFLFLDTTQAPFVDVRVRRALNYAIDRRRIVELGGGPDLRQPTCQVIVPDVPGYVRYCPYTLDPRPTGEWTAPDLAKARRLIRASGTHGRKVTVWSWRGGFENEARYIVSLLRRLGYRAHLKELRGLDVYFGEIHDRKTRAQSGIAGWYGQVSGDTVFAFECDSEINPTRFCDRRIDTEATHAKRISLADPEAAAEIWARLDRQLVDQAPWVPLFNPKTPYLVSARVGDWQFSTGGVLLDQLWVR